MSRLRNKALLLVAALAAAVPFLFPAHPHHHRSTTAISGVSVRLAANLEPQAVLRFRHPVNRSPDTAKLPRNRGGSPPKVVVVRPGDSLTGLAAKLGTTWTALAAFNHLADPNLILPGQQLRVPPVGYRAPASWLPTVVVGLPEARPAVAAVAHVAAPAVTYQPAGGVWGCIAAHESGGNPAENTGNGYYGMYQFAAGTWQTMMSQMGVSGYSAYPYAAAAPASLQLAAAEHLQAEAGWGQWPVTSGECGV